MITPGTKITIASDDLFISAGTNGTAGTISVNGTVSAKSITFDDNVAITLSGGTSITLDSGITVASGNNATNAISTALILGTSTVSLTNNGTGALNITGNVTGFNNNAGSILTLSATSSGNIALSTGVIADASPSKILGLTVNSTGSGLVTLSGVNTYTGVTTISAGVLSVGTIGNGGVAGNLGQANNAAANLVLGGGTLQYTGATATTDRNFTLTAGTISTIDVTTNNLTISGASTATSGALTKMGAGTLTLSGANLYTGLTTVSAGTLAYGASNVIATGAVTVNGATAVLDLGASHSDSVGTVTVGGGGSITGGTSALTSTGTFEMQSGSVSATLAGTSIPLSKTTGGTVTLSGVNTYTGVTTISAGVLSVGTIGNGGVAGNLGQANNAAANLVLGGGTLQYTGATATTDRNFTLTAGTISTIDVTTNNLTISGASTATSGALTKMGAGTLTLSGANLYTGLTTVSAGTLSLNRSTADNSAVSSSSITINGGILQIGASEQINNSAAITLNSGTFTFSGSNRIETVATFTNNGGTFATGTGTGNKLVVTGNTIDWDSGTNTITSGNSVSDVSWNIRGGTNTVNGGAAGGVLQVGTGGTGLNFTGTGTPVIALDSSASTAGKILLQGNVTVDGTLTGKAQILSGGALANPGFIDMDGGTRTFTVSDAIAGTDLEISASIQNGGLTKSGAGTMTLTGSNTYTGTTTISNSGGTLGLSGSGALTATSQVTVNTGGTLLLGASDKINNAATVTLAGGTFNTGGFSETVGSLTLSSNSVIDLAAGGSLLHFAASGGNSWTGQLSIWNWSGNSSGGGTDEVFFGTSNSGLTSGQLNQISFFSGSGTGFLGTGSFTGSLGEIVPVPEPSSVALAVGLLGLINWRERRKTLLFSRKSRLAGAP